MVIINDGNSWPKKLEDIRSPFSRRQTGRCVRSLTLDRRNGKGDLNERGEGEDDGKPIQYLADY